MASDTRYQIFNTESSNRFHQNSFTPGITIVKYEGPKHYEKELYSTNSIMFNENVVFMGHGQQTNVSVGPGEYKIITYLGSPDYKITLQKVGTQDNLDIDSQDQANLTKIYDAIPEKIKAEQSFYNNSKFNDNQQIKPNSTPNILTPEEKEQKQELSKILGGIDLNVSNYDKESYSQYVNFTTKYFDEVGNIKTSHEGVSGDTLRALTGLTITDFNNIFISTMFFNVASNQISEDTYDKVKKTNKVLDNPTDPLRLLQLLYIYEYEKDESDLKRINRLIKNINLPIKTSQPITPAATSYTINRGALPPETKKTTSLLGRIDNFFKGKKGGTKRKKTRRKGRKTSKRSISQRKKSRKYRR